MALVLPLNKKSNLEKRTIIFKNNNNKESAAFMGLAPVIGSAWFESLNDFFSFPVSNKENDYNISY